MEIADPDGRLGRPDRVASAVQFLASDAASLTFWATPPDHGCLTPEVIHPANLCFNVSAAEGEMVAPLAVSLQAAAKAQIGQGDIAVVPGAGLIGLMQALTALLASRTEVPLCDPLDAKLELATQSPGIAPPFARNGTALEPVTRATGGWDADLLFECSGAPSAVRSIAGFLWPGGTLVAIGMPIDPVAGEIATLQIREITVRTVFR